MKEWAPYPREPILPFTANLFLEGVWCYEQENIYDVSEFVSLVKKV